jgi:3-phenylpropionate/trans-cinnamate dioxygenase ferredoxin reductase subunit
MAAPTFVVVGASLAGATAALKLRDEGFDGRLLLVGAEEELPYERPPLSKEYLRGERPFAKLLVRPAEAYDTLGIELRLGACVRAIDPSNREIELEGGARIPYDKVLVCTGGRNRRFPIPGIDLEGVYGLRTVADADRLREEAREGRRAVVVGMGFIARWLASASSQPSRSPRPRGSSSRTAWPSTSDAGRASRGSTPPETWPAIFTPCSGVGSGSSTG